MNITPHRRPERIAVLLVCVLSLMAFSIACRLAPAYTLAAEHASASLAQTIFGDTRIAIGSRLYTQADVYFHRGVPHQQECAFGSDLYQRLRDEVSPSQHVHLEGATDIREIMPWLDLATRANPEDSESYLVAAFWLSNSAHRPELALDVLDRAQRNIPYAYDVQLAKGRLFLHTGRYAYQPLAVGPSPVKSPISPFRPRALGPRQVQAAAAVAGEPPPRR